MLAMKQIRERLGLTQTAVARELGVSRQTYNNWELGKRQADYEYLLRLGELFNTSVENILTGCLENAPPLTEQQARLAEFVKAGDPSDTARLLMGLPEKEKKPLAAEVPSRSEAYKMIDALPEEDYKELRMFIKYLKFRRSQDKE